MCNYSIHDHFPLPRLIPAQAQAPFATPATRFPSQKHPYDPYTDPFLCQNCTVAHTLVQLGCSHALCLECAAAAVTPTGAVCPLCSARSPPDWLPTEFTKAVETAKAATEPYFQLQHRFCVSLSAPLMRPLTTKSGEAPQPESALTMPPPPLLPRCGSCGQRPALRACRGCGHILCLGCSDGHAHACPGAPASPAPLAPTDASDGVEDSEGTCGLGASDLPSDDARPASARSAPTVLCPIHERPVTHYLRGVSLAICPACPHPLPPLARTTVPLPRLRRSDAARVVGWGVRRVRAAAAAAALGRYLPAQDVVDRLDELTKLIEKQPVDYMHVYTLVVELSVLGAPAFDPPPPATPAPAPAPADLGAIAPGLPVTLRNVRVGLCVLGPEGPGVVAGVHPRAQGWTSLLVVRPGVGLADENGYVVELRANHIPLCAPALTIAPEMVVADVEALAPSHLLPHTPSLSRRSRCVGLVGAGAYRCGVGAAFPLVSHADVFSQGVGRVVSTLGGGAGVGVVLGPGAGGATVRVAWLGQGGVVSEVGEVSADTLRYAEDMFHPNVSAALYNVSTTSPQAAPTFSNDLCWLNGAEIDSVSSASDSDYQVVATGLCSLALHEIQPVSSSSYSATPRAAFPGFEPGFRRGSSMGRLVSISDRTAPGPWDDSTDDSSLPSSEN